MVVPAYLGEVAPAALRGRIVEAYEVMLCLGMLSAMLVDAALQHAPHNWRLMVGAPIVPAFVLASESSSLLPMTSFLIIQPAHPQWALLLVSNSSNLLVYSWDLIQDLIDSCEMVCTTLKQGLHVERLPDFGSLASVGALRDRGAVLGTRIQKESEDS